MKLERSSFSFVCQRFGLGNRVSEALPSAKACNTHRVRTVVTAEGPNINQVSAKTRNVERTLSSTYRPTVEGSFLVSTLAREAREGIIRTRQQHHILPESFGKRERDCRATEMNSCQSQFQSSSRGAVKHTGNRSCTGETEESGYCQPTFDAD